MKNNNLSEVVVHREERCWIRDSKTLAPTASAQIDVFYICGNHALIIDCKSGFLDVASADINWQVKVQVVALFHEYPSLTHIRGAISQGRGSSKFDCCDFTRADLEWIEKEIRFYIKLSEQPDAPRVPGSHCRYCKARGACLEASAWALVPNVVTQVATKDRVAERVELLSPAALAFIHSRAPLATEIFDAVKKRLLNMPADELTAVGLERKPNAGMRKVTNIQEAWEVLSREGLCTEEEFRDLCKLSITAVEEATVSKVKERLRATVNPKATNEEAKKELGRLLAPSVTIIPKSDSLKPIKPQIKE